MINKNIFIEKITTYLEKMDEKKQPQSLEVFADEISYTFNKDGGAKPFYIFGISKLFIATLVNQLHELDVIDREAPIHTYLDEEMLSNLFVFRGTDYQKDVTISMLLNHTSGLADYFEGIGANDKQFYAEMINNPDHTYEPIDLINYTKTYQVALGIPGNRYYYSDTGYVLLGILLERVSKKPLEVLINDHIIKPFNLKHTSLLNQKFDGEHLEDVLYNGVNIKSFKSLTCQWGGSGIISTHQDLIKFIRNLTLTDANYPNTFIKGIQYGSGSMELKLDQLSFLSRTSIKTPFYGHMSFYGTHLWADPQNKLYISINFGTNKNFEKSFKIIAYITKTYHQLINET